MARLAALVLLPRKRLMRHHRVFAPHSRQRAATTPSRACKGKKREEEAAEHPVPKQVAMSWTQCLNRVFGIEIEACARCSGRLKATASTEGPAVIARILGHLNRASATPGLLPPAARAPPIQSAPL